MKKKILILHGWQGNNDNNWQEFLAKFLKSNGLEVSYPKFPNPDYPDLNNCLKILNKEIQKLAKDDQVIVVTHSLGGALWLHYVARNPQFKPNQVILVSPPPDDCEVDEIKSFFPLPDLKIDPKDVSYLAVGSDNDQFISLEKFKAFSEKFNIPFHLIPNAGHINVTSGFGEWDWIQKLLIS